MRGIKPSPTAEAYTTTAVDLTLNDEFKRWRKATAGAEVVLDPWDKGFSLNEVSSTHMEPVPLGGLRRRRLCSDARGRVRRVVERSGERAMNARPSSRRSPHAGNRGQGGHWIRERTRARIYARDNHCCIWCGVAVTPKLSACLDHVIPRERGGSNRHTNLVTSCFACNEARGTQLAFEWARIEFEFADRVLTRMCAALQAPLPQVA